MDLQKESVYALKIFTDAEGHEHMNTHTWASEKKADQKKKKKIGKWLTVTDVSG